MAHQDKSQQSRQPKQAAQAGKKTPPQQHPDWRQEKTGTVMPLQPIYHFIRGISRTPEYSVARMLKEVISTILKGRS